MCLNGISEGRTTGARERRVSASDASAETGVFGSVAIAGNRIILGARLNDEVGGNSGAAYVFARHRGGVNNWGQVKKLVPADAARGDQFGMSVALAGNKVIVGAQLNDDPDTSAGSAYVFGRDKGGPDQWGLVRRFSGRDTAGYDLFGWSVARSGQTSVVGAIRNDRACPFRNDCDAGSAYVFKFMSASSSPSTRFPLWFLFSDPRKDHLQLTPVRRLNPPRGVVDVERLLFSFDRRTGEYEIKVTASPANPFVGDVRINVLLFNPDTGTSAQNPAFFEDSLIVSLATRIRTLKLVGSNPRLRKWWAGHRVAPCQGEGFEELGAREASGFREAFEASVAAW